MSTAELTRLMAVGAAAQYLSAHAALGQAKTDKYKKLQQNRANDAAQILRKLGMPQAESLMRSPSRSSAKALTKALANVDLTAKLGRALPPKSSYK